MKVIRKTRTRWTGVFRAPGPSDLLLVYAGEAPSCGVAVWHKHPGNDRPHVHIHQHESDDHHHHDHAGDNLDHSHIEHASHDYQIADSTHCGETEGHWHLAIPAHQLRAVYALLVFAVSSEWFAINDTVPTTEIRRSHAAARAPPSLA